MLHFQSNGHYKGFKQPHSRSLAIMPFARHYMISYQSQQNVPVQAATDNWVNYNWDFLTGVGGRLKVVECW